YRQALTDALAGAVKLAERAVADDGEKSVRQAATALYNCTTAIAMAWEASKTGSSERLRLSQLVVAHRVLPWDPLNEGGVPAEWVH
ncbi:MAG: DNA alkylation response protein, partial [Proteobacteria bacterium]|nr:DNA alkylation response protein [Pseudomonadota bacterium]